MKQGFSLIEILVVVAIATAIVFVVGGLSSNTNILNLLVSHELQSRSDIAQSLQIMTTQIRSATDGANGSYPIVSADTSTFIFYSNGDNNGVAERVRYFFASSTIWRGTVQPTGTPATYPTSDEAITTMFQNVSLPASSSLFLYYGDSYVSPTSSAMTSTADVAPIRLVRVSFYVLASSSATSSVTPAPQYFSRLVDIRNLRDQL